VVSASCGSPLPTSGSRPVRPSTTYRGKELRPGPSADRNHTLKEYIRENAETGYHFVGTCRMGSGPDAVVDGELRVRGIEGLRVVDASVMPEATNGNTNAPTIMIAERAADLINGRSMKASIVPTFQTEASQRCYAATEGV